MIKTLALLLLFALNSQAHTRLVSPIPRSNNSGIKNGPCGGLPHSTSPTIVKGGTTLNVSWEETIDHPGKFLIYLSYGNDANFQQNLLLTYPDMGGSQFSSTVQIPNVDCPNCTLQLVQSMEENPAAPSYYYSCADIKITLNSGTTPTPTGQSGTNQAQGTVKLPNSSTGKFGGGCGLVSTDHRNPPSGPGASLLFVFLPVMFGLWIRRQQNA